MTTASKITLIRVLMIPVYMGLMYASGGRPGLWMFAALGLFILASLTDFVDGYIGTAIRSAISASFWTPWPISSW